VYQNEEKHERSCLNIHFGKLGWHHQLIWGCGVQSLLQPEVIGCGVAGGKGLLE